MKTNSLDTNGISVTPISQHKKYRGFQRSKSEASFNVDWNKLDEKYCKLGRNGYTKGELEEHAKQLPLNGINGNVTIPFYLEDENVQEKDENDSVEKTFAGRRNVLEPASLQEKEILSRKGSVRGFKNRVRAGITTFLRAPPDNSRKLKEHEKGKIVIYTTSTTIVRETYERCKLVKKILQNHMIRYEEKDLFMNKDNQRELVERVGSYVVSIPQVFADGSQLGSAEQIENLNEMGELKKILDNFEKINVRHSCEKCGGYRYNPCVHCHGSKKSLKRNYFTEEFSSLRCMQCDENGLQRCDMCLDQQE